MGGVEADSRQSFGRLMNRVGSLVAMAVLYFLLITPVGLIVRLFRRDLLRRRLDPDGNSYWIERGRPGPSPETMTKQF